MDARRCAGESAESAQAIGGTLALRCFCQSAQRGASSGARQPRAVDGVAGAQKEAQAVGLQTRDTLAAEARARNGDWDDRLCRWAGRQGILSLVAEALREQHANPHWEHAFDFDELCALALAHDATNEAELAEAIRLFVADTKPEHRVDVLAATLPEDLLAGSIVAYAAPGELIELLERSKVN